MRIPDHSLSTARTVQNTASNGQKLRHPKTALSRLRALEEKQNRIKKRPHALSSTVLIQSSHPDKHYPCTDKHSMDSTHRTFIMTSTNTSFSLAKWSIPPQHMQWSLTRDTYLVSPQALPRRWKRTAAPPPTGRTGWEKHAQTLGNNIAEKKKDKGGGREGGRLARSYTRPHLTCRNRRSSKAVARKRKGRLPPERSVRSGEFTYMKMRCENCRREAD